MFNLFRPARQTKELKIIKKWDTKICTGWTRGLLGKGLATLHIRLEDGRVIFFGESCLRLEGARARQKESECRNQGGYLGW